MDYQLTPDALPNSVDCQNAQVVFGIAPRFLSPRLAGKYLGHSGEWLNIHAKEHDLFKPTIRGRGKGSPNFYDREHLDLIANYMTEHPDFLESKELMDEAMMLWIRRRRNRKQQHFDQAK